MGYLAALVGAAAVMGACMLFLFGTKAGSVQAAWRWPMAALVTAALSAALLQFAFSPRGGFVDGTLGLIGLLLWLVSHPMELTALVMIGLTSRCKTKRSVLVPLLVTALAFAATWIPIVRA